MHYEEMDAWRKSMDLVDAIYDTVLGFPRSELFVLSHQMRSAALSIPSNIAEGNGRWTRRDYRHFLIQARGSACELQTTIHVAQRRRFLTEVDANRLLNDTRDVCRMLNGLIRHLDGDPFDEGR